jgi:hypothetical protein
MITFVMILKIRMLSILNIPLLRTNLLLTLQGVETVPIVEAQAKRRRRRKRSHTSHNYSQDSLGA